MLEYDEFLKYELVIINDIQMRCEDAITKDEDTALRQLINPSLKGTLGRG